MMNVEGEISSLSNKFNRIIEKVDKASLFVLDGRSMKTLDGLFDEFSRVLSFPEYFGRNFNALSECLSDLAWLDCTTFVIFIAEGWMVLEDEALDVFQGLINILATVGNEWSQPVSLGEEWDRDSVPFHVVFQVNSLVSNPLNKLPSLDLV